MMWFHHQFLCVSASSLRLCVEIFNAVLLISIPTSRGSRGIGSAQGRIRDYPLKPRNPCSSLSAVARKAEMSLSHQHGNPNRHVIADPLHVTRRTCGTTFGNREP